MFSECICSSYYLLLLVNNVIKGQHRGAVVSTVTMPLGLCLHRYFGFLSQSKDMHLGKHVWLFFSISISLRSAVCEPITGKEGEDGWVE